MQDREELLFERFRKEGATDALGELYDLVAPELLHVALHLAGDPHRAEELLQATLVAAIEQAERFEPGRRVRPWLLGILAHKARAMRRDARRVPDPERFERPAAPAPEDEAARKELDEALERALFQLPEEWRAVLVLRLRHGLTATEIAHALSRPPGTVRSQLARGIERLRGVLPAGLATALAVGPLRGLEGLRAIVLEHASTWQAAQSAAAPVAVGGLVMKKGIVAAAALLAAASAALVVSLPAEAPNEELARVLTPIEAEQHVNASESVAREARAFEAPAGASIATPDERAIDRPPPRAEAELGAVLVRVVEGDASVPVRGMLVLLAERGSGAEHPEREMITDAAGLARFDGVRPGRARVALFESLGESVRVRGGETSELVLRLEGALVVEGSVVDARGEPLPGASIWLSRIHRAGEGRSVGIADERGRFTLAGVRAGQFVGARARGFAPSYLQAVYGAAGERVPIRIELLDAGGAAHGRVVDARGEPIAGASVLLGVEEVRCDVVLANGLATPGAPPARVVTDELGRFAVESAPLGVQPVRARATGFGASWSEAWIDGAAPAEIELVLRPAARVTGRVLDASGEPVRGARIACANVGEFAASTAWSGRDGGFELDGLPAGELALTAAHDDAGTAAIELELSAGEARTWEARLARSPEICGIVRDEEGHPLSGWIVNAFDRSQPPPNWKHTTTDARGRFVLAALAPRPHDVHLHEPQASREFPRLVLRDVEPGSAPLELAVDASGRDQATLEGYVLGPGSVPVAGVQLTVWHEELEELRTFEPRAQDGRFEVRVPPGRLHVSARSQDWPWIELEPFEIAAGESRDLGTLFLERGARLVGTIEGIADEHVESLELVLAAKQGNARSIVTRTGREYRSGPLAPGTWTLHVRGDFVLSRMLEFEVAGEHELRRDVALERASMRRIRLVPPPDSPDLRPWCVALDAQGLAAWTCPRLDFVDGVYEARVSVAPGSYLLRASAEGGLAAEARLDVARGDAGGEPLVLELK